MFCIWQWETVMKGIISFEVVLDKRWIIIRYFVLGVITNIKELGSNKQITALTFVHWVLKIWTNFMREYWEICPNNILNKMNRR